MTVGEDAFLYHQLANYERVRTMETLKRLYGTPEELDLLSYTWGAPKRTSRKHRKAT